MLQVGLLLYGLALSLGYRAGLGLHAWGLFQNALTKFLRDRNLAVDTASQPNFFDTMIAAVQAPSDNGMTWCNDTPHRVMAAIGADDGKAITTRG